MAPFSRKKVARKVSEDSSQDSNDASLNDWREFRARLIRRETEGDEAVSSQAEAEPWLHITPLIEKGSVLLAKPGPWTLSCPCFHKAVILITEHQDGAGSMGFILNRPTARVAEVGNIKFNVYYGGPCQSLEDPEPEQWSYCLHTRNDLGSFHSEEVVKGVFLIEPLAAYDYINRGQATAEDFMFIVGHAGWADGQLQDELDDGEAWTMVASDPKALLGSLPRQQRALARQRVLGRGLPMWRRLARRVKEDGYSWDLPRILDRKADENLWDWVNVVLVPDFRGTLAEAEDMESQQEASPSDEVVYKVVLDTIALMEAGPENLVIQENGCEALRNMIVDEASREVVARNGGIQVVLGAMRGHGGHAGIQGHCSGTLTHLAGGSKQRERIVALGGLDDVIKGMAAHPTSQLVQYKGCAVLANFAHNILEQQQVGSAGGVKASIRAMQLHADDKDVQDYCMGTLYNLARAYENREKIAAEGGIQVIKQALVMHPDASTVQRVGKNLVETLSRDFD